MLVLGLFVSIMITGMLSGCTNESKIVQSQNTSNLAQKKIGLVLSIGGKGDKSFNDSSIIGLEKAKQELGITYKAIEPKTLADCRKSLEFLAKENYDLVIGVGYLMQKDLYDVALKYPKVKFAIIDFEYDKIPSNVKCLRFEEHEGSFLAGALAAYISKTKTVGFIGGMDTSKVHRFEGGYIAGAKYVNPKIIVLSNYAGTDATAFNNPDKGKEIALDMISKNADVIYHASGGTGLGVFEACGDKGVKTIGVDINQNYAKPGTVVASVLKRVDIVIFDSIKAIVENSFETGSIEVFGLEEDGVSLTDLYNLTPEETSGLKVEEQEKIQRAKNSIPKEVKEKLKEIREKIISKEIKVPDWQSNGKPKG